MLNTKIISASLAAIIMFASCASTTVIQSIPTGAKLYLDNEPVGVTPYTHRDTKIMGTTTTVRLEKEGYKSLYASFSRDELADAGAIIAGVFVLIPFLWTMKYKPLRTYELAMDSEDTQPATESTSEPETTQSKAEKLRELKQLLDEGIITQEEFDEEKKKILDN